MLVCLCGVGLVWLQPPSAFSAPYLWWGHIQPVFGWFLQFLSTGHLVLTPSAFIEEGNHILAAFGGPYTYGGLEYWGWQVHSPHWYCAWGFEHYTTPYYTMLHPTWVHVLPCPSGHSLLRAPTTLFVLLRLFPNCVVLPLRSASSDPPPGIKTQWMVACYSGERVATLASIFLGSTTSICSRTSSSLRARWDQISSSTNSEWDGSNNPSPNYWGFGWSSFCHLMRPVGHQVTPLHIWPKHC